MKTLAFVVCTFVLAGCATLLNKGVIGSDDIVAACADITSLCANPVAKADPNVAQFCSIFAPSCAHIVPAPTTTTTLPAI